MGGDLNIAARLHDNKIISCNMNTGSIQGFFQRKDFIQNPEETCIKVFKKYNDDDPDFHLRLYPDDYGLIFIDIPQKQILSFQDFCKIQRMPSLQTCCYFDEKEKNEDYDSRMFLLESGLVYLLNDDPKGKNNPWNLYNDLVFRNEAGIFRYGPPYFEMPIAKEKYIELENSEVEGKFYVNIPFDITYFDNTIKCLQMFYEVLCQKELTGIFDQAIKKRFLHFYD